MAVSRRLNGQSPFGGDAIGRNPTDRGKPGTKRSILVDASGGPLSIVVAGANVHDAKLLEATLVYSPDLGRHQSRCGELSDLVNGQESKSNPTDRGKPGTSASVCWPIRDMTTPLRGHETVARYGYQPHIRRIGEEKLDVSGQKRYPARRWVVERTLGWLSKCRGLLVRYEKKAENYLAMLQLSCALLWYRRWWQLRF